LERKVNIFCEKEENNMKKRGILLLIILGMVSACSEGEKPTVPGPSQTLSIIGSWRYEYPTNRCVEIYEFATDGTFVIKSAEEVISGTYSFQDTVPMGDRHSLTISITADNQLPDCEGKTKNHAGSINDFFVEFYSENKIGWSWKNQQSSIILELIQ
jgi:hypothetical protein